MRKNHDDERRPVCGDGTTESRDPDADSEGAGLLHYDPEAQEWYAQEADGSYRYFSDEEQEEIWEQLEAAILDRAAWKTSGPDGEGFSGR